MSGEDVGINEGDNMIKTEINVGDNAAKIIRLKKCD